MYFTLLEEQKSCTKRGGTYHSFVVIIAAMVGDDVATLSNIVVIEVIGGIKLLILKPSSNTKPR